MNKDYIIAPAHIGYELQQAEISAVAVKGLLEDLITPVFECFTCAGLLDEKSKHTGGDKGAAALEWMEENFNALYAACFAADALSQRVMDILQMLPRVQEPNKTEAD